MIVVRVRVARRVLLSMVLVVLVVVLIVMVTIAIMHLLDGRGGITTADGTRVRMVHATPCQHVPQDGAKRGSADQAVHRTLGLEKDRRFHGTRCSNLRLA
jgi:hypothetical protein